MPRPRKWRTVCCMPNSTHFGPLHAPVQNNAMIVLAVEEYEAIRLIDLEELTQEECASQMKIARTTVQGIYSQARKKVADALVNGKVLHIEGGDYQICNGDDAFCSTERCCRRQHGRNRLNQMQKI